MGGYETGNSSSCQQSVGYHSPTNGEGLTQQADKGICEGMHNIQ